MSITWNDYDCEIEGETVNKVMTFTRKYDSCNESSDEEMLTEELAETYREALTKWRNMALYKINKIRS